MAGDYTKACTRCNETKAITAFSRSKKSKNGFGSWCKECRAANERDRRRKNPERFRALEKARYAKDGAKRRRESRRRNPYGHKLTKLKQEYGAETMPYIEALLHDPCSYCGERTGDIGIDHIVPRSQGGDNHWSNLTACCNQCNGRKHAKPLLRALLERSGFFEYRPGWAE